jgi:hypothetical protein
MSLRNVPRSQLSPAEQKKLDRAEQGRTGRKAIRRVAERTTVPATGHPGYRSRNTGSES